MVLLSEESVTHRILESNSFSLKYSPRISSRFSRSSAFLSAASGALCVDGPLMVLVTGNAFLILGRLRAFNRDLANVLAVSKEDAHLKYVVVSFASFPFSIWCSQIQPPGSPFPIYYSPVRLLWFLNSMGRILCWYMRVRRKEYVNVYILIELL